MAFPMISPVGLGVTGWFDMDQHDGVGQMALDPLLYAVTDGVRVLDAHLLGQCQVEVDMAATPA